MTRRKTKPVVDVVDVLVCGSACAILVLTSLAVRACEATAQAQHRVPAHVMLARTCVSERGWLVDTDDCRAIGEVAQTRMARTGDSWASALRALSPRLHGRARVHRAWIRELTEDGERPRSLRGVSWTELRPAWMATLEEARAIVSGEAGRVCAEVPRAWGSVADIARRARTRRFARVDCGWTRNAFGEWR